MYTKPQAKLNPGTPTTPGHFHPYYPHTNEGIMTLRSEAAYSMEKEKPGLPVTWSYTTAKSQN